jgi:hypothetical protein
VQACDYGGSKNGTDQSTSNDYGAAYARLGEAAIRIWSNLPQGVQLFEEAVTSLRASATVRSVPPSLVGRGRVSSDLRYAEGARGGDIKMNL